MTGDGKAISSYKGTCFHSSYVWYLKDRIDKGFMDKFDTKKMGASPLKTSTDTINM